jgi:prepilin-type N-terminal cleavage/methylation domain-containing protein
MRQAGFTLLEMLVVLVLLALLTATLAGTINLGLHARTRLSATARDEADLAAFQLVLADTLGRAAPTPFTGGSDHLVFLAPALEAQGPGLAQVRLFRAGHVIRLQTRLDATPPGPWLTADFAPGLAALSIRYFGPKAGWQTTWVKQDAAPELVSLTLRFPPGDRRSWPVLVFHPQIEADATCQIDPETHRCVAP